MTALKKYAGRARVEKGDRVAKIALDRLPAATRIIDGRSACLDEEGRSSKAYRFANHDDEVVLESCVPPSAIIDVVEFHAVSEEEREEASAGTKRISTPSRRKRTLVHDCEWRDERVDAYNRREGLTPQKIQRVEFRLAGVSMYAEAVEALTVDQEVALKCENDNRFDPNAVLVVTEHGDKLGYIPRDRAV